MSSTLTVEGMSCAGCEQTVEDTLRDLDAVTDATADHEADTVTVEGDADPDDLVAAVEAAGYDARA